MFKAQVPKISLLTTTNTMPRMTNCLDMTPTTLINPSQSSVGRRVDLSQTDCQGDMTRCTECDRSFRSKRGVGVHRRKAHPLAYHAGIEAEKHNTLKRKRWTVEENRLLARAELELRERRQWTVGEMNRELHSQFPERSLDAIKGRRRLKVYQDVLSDLVFQELEGASGGTGGMIDEPEGDINRGENQTEREYRDSYLSAMAQANVGLVNEFGNVLGFEEISERFEVFVYSGKPRRIAKAPPKRVNAPSKPVKAVSRRVRKHAERGKMLKLYEKGPERLGKSIVNGVGTIENSTALGPEPEVMFDFWSNVFSKPSVRDTRPPLELNPTQWDIAKPITIEETKEAMRRLKNGAPGRDGLRAAKVKALCPSTLTGFFNAFLYHEDLPQFLKEGTTTLIAKVENPADAGEFRPITLSSVVLRLFHTIVASRLGAIPLTQRQKGFRQLDGCGENVWLLKNLVSLRIRQLQSLNIVFCDVKKAFDSVSHQSMVRACSSVGIPAPWVRYLQNAHTGLTTVLKLDPLMRSIDCTVGVRQGDPVSCHIFNYVMAVAIQEVSEDIGIPFRGLERPLGYGMLADDTFLVSETKAGLRRTFFEFEKALSKQGMKLNPAKCKTLQVEVWQGRKKWFVAGTPFLKAADGTVVETLTIAETYRYLGTEMGAGGVTDLVGKGKLKEKLGRLRVCALKPQQKLYILRTILIPSFYHVLSLAEFAPKKWRDYDRQVRHFVRSVLHLPNDTPMGFFHASQKSGGLAVPSFVTQVGRLRSDRLKKLFESEDPVIKSLVETDSFLKEEVRRHEKPVRIQGLLFSMTKEGSASSWAELLHSSVDGKGLAHHSPSDPYKSFWVIDKWSRLSGREYISALHVRGSLLKTPSRASRGRAHVRKTCKSCCDRVCNLGHTLQVCPRTHGQRILRHNEVVDGIRRVAGRKNVVVRQEPRVAVKNTHMKPDLVLYGKKDCYVVDPMVCGDGGDLSEVHKIKSAKYRVPEVLAFVEAQHKVHFPSEPKPQITISGAVLDWRGCWAPESYLFLKGKLGMTPAELEYVSIRCLLASRKIWYMERCRAD